MIECELHCTCKPNVDWIEFEGFRAGMCTAADMMGADIQTLGAMAECETRAMLIHVFEGWVSPRTGAW